MDPHNCGTADDGVSTSSELLNKFTVCVWVCFGATRIVDPAEDGGVARNEIVMDMNTPSLKL